MKKTILGLYQHNPRGSGGEGESKLLKRIEMPVPINEFIRRKKWKQEVEATVREEGFDVLAVNVVHSGGDLDVNIVVTIDKKPPRFGEKKKAVTRGGQPVGQPVKRTSKTMAAKRRSARETPRQQ